MFFLLSTCLRCPAFCRVLYNLLGVMSLHSPRWWSYLSCRYWSCSHSFCLGLGRTSPHFIQRWHETHVYPETQCPAKPSLYLNLTNHADARYVFLLKVIQNIFWCHYIIASFSSLLPPTSASGTLPPLSIKFMPFFFNYCFICMCLNIHIWPTQPREHYLYAFVFLKVKGRVASQNKFMSLSVSN